MADDSARWTGLEKFKARIAVIPAKQKAAMAAVLEANAADLVAGIKGFAPVKTGRLRDSVRQEAAGELRVRVMAGGPATTVAARAGHGKYDYALGVEFGHVERGAAGEGDRHVPARPFFWPTYRAKKKGMKARGAKAFRDAVRSA